MSVAIAVGFITLAGVAAEIGVLALRSPLVGMLADAVIGGGQT